MNRPKPPIHGADHLPGHADPIPGLVIGGIPPWISADPGVTIDPSSGGGDTNPSTTTVFAAQMIQTVEGITYDEGGTPVNGGTFLGVALLTVDDPGSPKAGGSSTGVLIFNLGQVGATPEGANHGYTIGTITLNQGSTVFTGTILANGRMVIGGMPDTGAPSGALINTVRVANPFLSTTGWPWEWVGGEIIEVSYQFPMQGSG